MPIMFNNNKSRDEAAEAAEAYMRGQIPQLMWANLQLHLTLANIRPCVTSDLNEGPTQADLHKVIEISQALVDGHEVIMDRSDFDTQQVFMAKRQKNLELSNMVANWKWRITANVDMIRERVLQDRDSKGSPPKVTRDTRAYLLRRALYAEYMLGLYSLTHGLNRYMHQPACSEPCEMVKPKPCRYMPTKRRLSQTKEHEEFPAKRQRISLNVSQSAEAIIRDAYATASLYKTIRCSFVADHLTTSRDVKVISLSWQDDSFADDENDGPREIKPRRKLFRKSRRVPFAERTEE